MVDVAAPLALIAVQDEPALTRKLIQLETDTALGFGANEPIDRVITASLDFAEEEKTQARQSEEPDNADPRLFCAIVAKDRPAVDDGDVDREYKYETSYTEPASESCVSTCTPGTFDNLHSRQQPKDVSAKQRDPHSPDVAENEDRGEEGADQTRRELPKLDLHDAGIGEHDRSLEPRRTRRSVLDTYRGLRWTCSNRERLPAPTTLSPWKQQGKELKKAMVVNVQPLA